MGPALKTETSQPTAPPTSEERSRKARYGKLRQTEAPPEGRLVEADVIHFLDWRGSRTSPDVASGLRVCVRWSESAEAACRLVALRSRAQELAAAIDPDYMQRHPALTWEMRKSLVDWIAAVHHSRRFSPEVLFLAVRIIDEYLAVAEPVLQPNLQLVGVAALALPPPPLVLGGAPLDAVDDAQLLLGRGRAEVRVRSV